MIPHRVKLKGFLCYKDEQTIEFDSHATLWMLSGLNGSGKSAIFDAVTYALFGHHRGGGQNAVELINKESDTMLVEFDFLLDSQPYRAKRTLKRDTRGGARGTQQMFRFEAGKWLPLEDTGGARAFIEWVANHIGLNYDTFTSSVLLLQGKAEKLLDSRPEGRREVLARIVDLGRYEQLHRRADDRRREMETENKSLGHQLSVLAPVEPLELEAARNRIAGAEERRNLVRAEVERLQLMEIQSKVWLERRDRLLRAQTRLGRAQKVLTDAGSIEQAVARLRDLREVLPRLNDIVVNRGEYHKAGENLTALGRDRDKGADLLAQRESALKQGRDKRTLVNNGLARDESQYRDVAGRLQKLNVQMTRLAECERQEGELGRLRQDLAGFPADPAGAVAKAREAHKHLEELGRLVPTLTRFVSRRDELKKALEQGQLLQQQLDEVCVSGEKLKKDSEALGTELQSVSQEAERAGEQATEARTLLARAKESLQELSQLDGSKVCRHCGQGLTEGHIKDEKRRRGADVKAAEERARQTASAQKEARGREQALKAKVNEADRAYQAARDQYRDTNILLKQARQSADRLQEECANYHADLPEALRLKVAAGSVADWSKTTWPAASDVDALRAESRGLEAARRKLTQAEAQQKQHDALRARESQTLETLERLQRDLPADRVKLRQQHQDLEAQEKALHRSLDAGRAQLGELDRDQERLNRERDAAQAQLGQFDTRLKEQQLVQQNAERNIAAGRKLLPATWLPQAESVGLRELFTLKAEQTRLEHDGTDEQARELEGARVNLEAMRQDVVRLEGEQDRFPEEARQDPDLIRSRLEEAKARDRGCDDEVGLAREGLALLESQRQQREELVRQHRELERDLTSQRLLAELLGRERLQLYLVRQAERQVVEYANAVLDRLSGGQLYLKLAGEASGDGDAKALELEAYNRATGDRPINVMFLSGSQKFRVAVSLALGIGQYASKQHRPIESVIIDEGFGCLDSQGRQVMIQELQNLRSQMRCILLVSHQEEFAEAFTDGYHFQLENGATRVKRIQK